MATDTHQKQHTHTRRCCSLSVNKLAADAKKSLYRWWISLHCALAPDRTTSMGVFLTGGSLLCAVVFLSMNWGSGYHNKIACSLTAPWSLPESSGDILCIDLAVKLYILVNNLPQGNFVFSRCDHYWLPLHLSSYAEKKIPFKINVTTFFLIAKLILNLSVNGLDGINVMLNLSKNTDQS